MRRQRSTPDRSSRAVRPALEGRVEREDDGSLSVYGSEAYAERFELLARRPIEEIVGRFDVSGDLRRWLERPLQVPSL